MLDIFFPPLLIFFSRSVIFLFTLRHAFTSQYFFEEGFPGGFFLDEEEGFELILVNHGLTKNQTEIYQSSSFLEPVRPIKLHAAANWVGMISTGVIMVDFHRSPVADCDVQVTHM